MEQGILSDGDWGGVLFLFVLVVWFCVYGLVYERIYQFLLDIMCTM